MRTLSSPNCSLCGDTGWRLGKPTELPASPAYVRCGCLLERLISRAVPLKFHRARLADFDPEFVSPVIAWLGNPTEGLLVMGDAGPGKTHMGCAIVRTMYELGKRATFARAADLYREVRESYNGGRSTETEILQSYCSTPMLILDDNGAGSLSDHERRILLDILDRRGNDCRPTVVTTNLSLDQIRDLMDERISSRLKDYLAVAFTGADRRGKRA